MERLDKLLAATGRWSRREAKALVKAGRVRVAGVLPQGPEDKITPGTPVTVDGRLVDTESFTYLMLHKPAGVVSATEDAREKTVLDLIPPDLRRRGLFPVGRLDKDTEGLLLLTNDGALSHQLLSPARHVEKVYYVEVEGQLDQADQAAFRRGIILADGTVCCPAGLTVLEEASHGLVAIKEGKYHQVRRMLAARGKPVTYIKRLSMGPITLDPDLPPGAWRPLTRAELAHLRR
ncbi:MAG TPA: rRNA pseudouridine synthase [Candidatus Evtepia faecavium]|nr:rRNA pseudouridine synthase [Candidatus Evtepia faecavium]